ncbi:MAG: hypothetical protein U0176_08640 [Bacteroidia bacterium]
MDPNLAITLGNPASYDDYPTTDFPLTERDGIVVKTYKGHGSPMHMVTPDVTIEELRIPAGAASSAMRQPMVISYLSRAACIAGKPLADDFRARSRITSSLLTSEDSKLFVICLRRAGIPSLRAALSCGQNPERGFGFLHFRH